MFKELLHQAKSRFDFRAPVSGSGRGSLPGTPLVMRRRTSLPQVMMMIVMMMMMMMMMMIMIIMMSGGISSLQQPGELTP